MGRAIEKLDKYKLHTTSHLILWCWLKLLQSVTHNNFLSFCDNANVQNPLMLEVSEKAKQSFQILSSEVQHLKNLLMYNDLSTELKYITYLQLCAGNTGQVNHPYWSSLNITYICHISLENKNNNRGRAG